MDSSPLARTCTGRKAYSWLRLSRLEVRNNEPAQGRKLRDCRIGGAAKLNAVLLISRGRGVLVGVIAFGSLLTTEFLTNRHFHDESYYQKHGWPKLTGFAVAAAIVRLLSPRVNFNESVSYPISGTRPPDRRSLFRKEDSLFLVPVRYWPWILCALGFAFYYY